MNKERWVIPFDGRCTFGCSTLSSTGGTGAGMGLGMGMNISIPMETDTISSSNNNNVTSITTMTTTTNNNNINNNVLYYPAHHHVVGSSGSTMGPVASQIQNRTLGVLCCPSLRWLTPYSTSSPFIVSSPLYVSDQGKHKQTFYQNTNKKKNIKQKKRTKKFFMSFRYLAIGLLQNLLCKPNQDLKPLSCAKSRPQTLFEFREQYSALSMLRKRNEMFFVDNTKSCLIKINIWLNYPIMCLNLFKLSTWKQ